MKPGKTFKTPKLPVGPILPPYGSMLKGAKPKGKGR